MRWHNSLGNDSIYSAAITERTILNVLYIFTKGDFLHRTKTAERVLANALVLVVCLIFAIGKIRLCNRSTAQTKTAGNLLIYSSHLRFCGADETRTRDLRRDRPVF